ncbi:helix-turn-helix transcriptional regulator [Streptomyces pharetrae]|uniref:helix-turn-helix transcriptional regulator n=1 Tax=Streptomyces pharetrae TaxID=291370 RepID=UPI003359D59E
MERISPHHAFVLRAAEALASADVDAACTALYASGTGATWPFPLARVRLYHGGWLRRHGRRAEARSQLAEALRLFTALGAGPWADRARQELSVCDAAPAPGGVAALTAQELRIAQLVALGLTNRDVGTRLQLSPRTVAGHLYKIYPKLGISSRAAVARALGQPPPPRTDGDGPGRASPREHRHMT